MHVNNSHTGIWRAGRIFKGSFFTISCTVCLATARQLTRDVNFAGQESHPHRNCNQSSFFLTSMTYRRQKHENMLWTRIKNVLFRHYARLILYMQFYETT